MSVDQLLGLVHAWPEAMLLVAANGTIIAGSHVLEEQFGLSLEELRGKRMDEVAESPGGILAYLRLCSRSRQLLPGSFAFLMTNGHKVPCRAQGAVLHPQTGDDSSVIFLRLIPQETAAQQFLALNQKIEELSKEIRRRNQAQMQLEAALHEKEVLLREVHHRVKNNMQVISGLLDLHTYQVKEPYVLQVLQEVRARIQVMALVHQRLYATEGMQAIDLGAFLQELVPGLARVYKNPDQAITVSLDVGQINVGLDSALACGLLTHELVSNALEHAFPDSRPGTIAVTLSHSRQDGKALLRISDDGIGLPAGFDLQSAETLGMQLVQSLARQIDASIVVRAERGTTFTFTFEVVH